MTAMPPTENTEQGFFLPDLCNGRAVLFLVLVAELIAIVLELAGSGLLDFSWQSFALKSMFMQWAVLSSAVVLCRLRPRLAALPVAHGAGLSYVLIIVVVLMLDILAQWSWSGAFGAGGWKLDVWQLGEHAIVTAVLAGITLRYFYLTQALHQRQQAELEARIQALQSRIRPHFLFNSMNIIASLIALDQDAAETAVEDLSALFRASLNEATEVKLTEEIDLCRRYARIEQQRLGSRLTMEWVIEDMPENIMIPSLTLQPLLENAIYHGIQHCPEGGIVRIEGTYTNGWVKLAVSNPLPEGVPVMGGGNRMAHENIQKRLVALYGRHAGLAVSAENDEYRAVMEYPYHVEEGA